MKSLVFPHIINIYDVILTSHLLIQLTKLYDAAWYLTMISETCKTSR